MSKHIDETAIERARLLVAAVADIAPPDHPKALDAGAAGLPYRRLHREYMAELEDSVGEAQAWWDGLIDHGMKRNRTSRERAERDALAEAPIGPAMHGRVLAAVRRFWLRCDALNRKRPVAERVPPEQFVLGWLIDAQSAHVAVLGRYTYFPVGLDADGNWV
ncbi:MAG: hypothetical protein H7255_15815 [Ramlibacter sp.]|nr:hypothetical protein [Ramlibacter sp.]